MALLALYPQINLWYERGAQWNGAYAFFDTDEVAYSAYLQALIDGRPRRNDPYTGRDHQAGAQQQQQGESIFSIQVVPAYALALVARALNLSSSTIFILLLALAGAASALSIFWLVTRVTGDERVGAAAALITLCLGILVNGQGAASIFIAWKAAYIHLPFLRRYVPGFSFPLYFVMCVLVWRALTANARRSIIISSSLAGVSFALMVYSYFYLWTTAAAWAACLALVWMAARPEGYREGIKSFGVFGAIAALSLIPYFILISRRAETMDAVQALTSSRAPDLFQPPEIVGCLTLLLLAWGLRRKLFDWRAKRVLFTASFALVPFVVFNQQVITGRSLQPLHYEEFIANYVALAGALMAIAIVWQGRAESPARIPSKVLLWAALAAFGWGFIESRVATDLFYQFNLPREEVWPVAVRLAAIERQRDAQARSADGAFGVTLTPDLLQADTLPSAGPQAVLWAPHMHVFSGVTLEEDKERFYQHLYYTGVDEAGFREALKRKNFYYLLAVYGWERANPLLALHPRPIMPEEDEDQTRAYLAYIASFDRETAARPQLSYLLLAAEGAQSLPNLDKWYERDAGERAGDFMLYRLRLKP
jgi:hypothetical protein